MLSLRSEDKIRARRHDMKRGPTTSEDSRRRRAGETLKLRTDKREELMAKRRRDLTPELGMGAEMMEVVTQRLNSLPIHIQNIFADDPSVVLPAITSLRDLLSLETRPPIQQCVNAGVVPRLVQLLQYNDYPNIQNEACWALTNIASGSSDQTAALVEAGAVEALLPLMTSNNLAVRGQSVWTLANIAGDGPQCRDYVLRQGAMSPLLALLMAPNPSVHILRDATWFLSNLCRGKDAPWDILSVAVPVLSRLLYSGDGEVLGDACWALLFLLEPDSSRAAKLLSDGIGPQIVSLLKHPSSLVQLPALRVVGILLFGDDDLVQALLNMHVLSGLEHLMNSDRKALRKESCWAVSNVTAGSTNLIQAVIDNKSLMDILLDFCYNGDHESRTEATYTLANAFNGGTMDQVRRLVSLGALEAISANLDSDDDRALTAVLDAIDRTLVFGKKDTKLPADYYLLQLEHCGAVDKIENLHDHESDSIYEQSVKILKSHWPTASDENSTPNVSSEGTYQWS